MFTKDEVLITIIFAGTVILLLLGIFIISFLFFYQKRNNAHIAQQKTLQSTFRQELLKAQNEIQEQTLMHVSQEIHDNITQVLSFVKLNLAMTGNSTPSQKEYKIDESRKLIAQVITDLRDLSKSMSFEHIIDLGLVKTIEIEAGRVSKSEMVAVEFTVNGEARPMGNQRELVLFRIFQEALNNSLKHSGAKHLKISLQYSDQFFNLTVEDDGAGFLTDTLKQEGSGLKNMQSRATLIGAVLTVNSEPGKGCCIKITIDLFSQQIYADGTYPNSPGR